jgi:hypothetical protein
MFGVGNLADWDDVKWLYGTCASGLVYRSAAVMSAVMPIITHCQVDVF